MNTAINIRNAHLAFGNQIVFSGLNLDIPSGKWVALLGRSGSGKSSILRSIAGLIPNQALNLHAQVAYMAQTDLLLPWLNVLDNCLLGYRLRGALTDTHRAYAKNLLTEVGLQDAIHAMPRTLSGGMRQRVALTRTMLEDRPIVLMDEPFSALDAITRFKLHATALELLAHKTVLFVTHDPLEALRLADEIYLLQPYPGVLKHVLSLTSAKPRDLNSPDIIQYQKVLYDELS